MRIQRINKSDPEKIFIVVMNSYSTATLTAGQAVQWDYTNDANGVSVTVARARATSAGAAVAGVVAESIAHNSYGMVQVFGYCASARVRNISGGTPAMGAGAPLAINSAGSVFCLENWDTGSTNIQVHTCGFAIGYTTKWTTATVAVFLKCL
jgi:hypothetical protein